MTSVNVSTDSVFVTVTEIVGTVATSSGQSASVVVADSSKTTVVEVAAPAQVIVANDVSTSELGPMRETPQVISQDYTVKATFNGLSVGTVEVAATYAVTVPSGATWAVV